MQLFSEQVTIENILKARANIRAFVKPTPLFRAEKLEELFGGAEIYLKLENFQYTGSFKTRGAANKILSLTKEELSRGVCAASSGNYAQAVAFVASRLKAKAVIVMPENAPAAKVEGVRGYGAEVVLYGLTGGDREDKCAELTQQYNYCPVHLHDDPMIIMGHATVTVEAAEQIRVLSGSFDEIVFPCGAGSLLSGAARASKSLMPNTKVTGVEPAAVPRFTMSLKEGKPLTVEMGQTIADGLRVGRAKPLNFELIRDNVDNLLTLEDEPIRRAVREAALRCKIIAEPSGCIGIAAALDGKIDTGAGRRICFVITGGNVDVQLLTDILNM